MDPTELRHMVDKSAEIHKASRNPKQRTPPEEDVYKFARASVVADTDMSAGHIIKEQDIWVRRPGSGEIPGFKYYDIIGKKLKFDVKKNYQLKWSHFH
jgi:N-acetylneuraminate synthase